MTGEGEEGGSLNQGVTESSDTSIHWRGIRASEHENYLQSVRLMPELGRSLRLGRSETRYFTNYGKTRLFPRLFLTRVEAQLSVRKLWLSSLEL